MLDSKADLATYDRLAAAAVEKTDLQGEHDEEAFLRVRPWLEAAECAEVGS